MKKKKFIVAIFIAIVILFIVITFCINNSKETVYSIDNIEPDIFYVGEKKYTLKKGETLEIDAWNPPTKIEYNGKNFNKVPVLFNGVTLGTKIKDVVKKFKLESGYANLNMEVAGTGSSGDTDIKNVLYEDMESLPKDFLDCCIIFGYKKENDGWKMVQYDYLFQADIVYYIDICGFTDEIYGYKETIEITVKYLTEEEKNEKLNYFYYGY